MAKRLFIHAPNVHQGGGLSLLNALLGSLDRIEQLTLIIDERLTLPKFIEQAHQIERVPPTIRGRFFAEKRLAETVTNQDVVLSFGNLPPLFKLEGYVFVYVQNRLLIDNNCSHHFDMKLKVRLALERLWLVARKNNCDRFIVQSPSMRRILKKRVKNEIPIAVLPFVSNTAQYNRRTNNTNTTETAGQKKFDFIYIASGYPHKNHENLIKAWCLLATKEIYPSLLVTIDQNEFPALSKSLKDAVSKNKLNIENVGLLASDEVKEAYDSASALIYPSTVESLGLPLIEASQAGLPIIAAELDFVRDVLDPVETFDPTSSVSIARSVQRFIDTQEPALPLHTASSFLDKLLNHGEETEYDSNG